MRISSWSSDGCSSDLKSRLYLTLTVCLYRIGDERAAGVGRYLPWGAWFTVFHEGQINAQQGGASASLWLTDSIRNGGSAQDRRGWREKLRDWAEDVELVPDLGQRVGSFTWFRGLATCLGLCAAALYLSPGFHPLPGAPQPLMPARQFDEVRSQMIMPLEIGRAHV